MTNPLDTWAMDREIVLSRVLDAPRERVFRAWVDADHLCHWFGPHGITCEMIECDIRTGGRWRFVMVMADGTRFENRKVFLEVKENERLVSDYGADVDNDPERFRATITLDAQRDGRTFLTLRHLHPTRQQRDATVAMGAVELGYQTLDKLANYLAGMK